MPTHNAKAEREALRAKMIALGLDIDQIAADFACRYRYRPRAAYRHAHGWTLQQAADRINAYTATNGLDTNGIASLTASRIWDYEAWPRGQRKPSLYVLMLLASVYQTDVRHLLDFEDFQGFAPADRLLIGQARTRAHVPESPARPESAEPVPYVNVRPRRSAGRPASHDGHSQHVPAANDSHVGAMETFRIADRRIGGGQLYDAVISYLKTEIAPRLFDGATGSDAVDVAAAAAGLTEMAGWMAHDSGRNALASEHFTKALAFARSGGHTQHAAHIYASMSHLALELHRPDEAARFARAGHHESLAAPASSSLTARLYAMQARGMAELGEHVLSEQHITRAYRALERGTVGEGSTWISPFDEGSLAMEDALCLRASGHTAAALRGAERCLALRDAGRARSRAFAQILVACLQVERGDIDAACHVATDLFDGIAAPGSARINQRLTELHTLLQPHRAARVVSEFLDRLAEARRARQRLIAGAVAGDGGFEGGS
jgi:hypothetical protein